MLFSVKLKLTKNFVIKLKKKTEAYVGPYQKMGIFLQRSKFIFNGTSWEIIIVYANLTLPVPIPDEEKKLT